MFSTPRRCLVAVGLVGGFTHACARVLGNGFSPRPQPRAPRGARRSRLRRDVHQGLVYSLPGFAGANRRRPKCLSRPHVPRRRLQLFFQQPCHRSVPTGSCSRAAERLVAPVSSMKFVRRGRAQARSFIDEIAGPALQCLGAGRAELFARGHAALGRRRFAPARRALSRAAASSLASQLGVA